MLCLFISACSFNEPYPSEWNAVLAVESCDSLIGTYSNNGERIQNSIIGNGSFSYAVAEQYSPKSSTFQIAKNNLGEFVLSFENSLTLSLQCSHDELELGLDTNFHGNQPGSLVLGVSTDTFYISKSSTDTLVVEQIKKEAGLILLVIPFVSQSNIWYRFESLNTPSQTFNRTP